MASDDIGEGRRVLGVIDATLTQLSVALVGLVPTLGAVLFRPSALREQIAMINDDGRAGVLLAPGPFFVIGLLCGLVAASFLGAQSDGALVAMGEEVRSAAGQGQFWRAASTAVPIFLGAVLLGIVFFLTAWTWRLAQRSLVASLRGAQYGLFGFIVVLAFAEPASNLLGPGGDNRVYEPVVVGATSVYMAAFHAFALASPADRAWARIGAALTIGAITLALSLLTYQI
ncbi:MAG: hypothetical protein ACFE0P_14010 [Oceanicaulis sp.]